MIAKVSLLSPQQAQFLQPISLELINEHVNESINEHIATSGYPEMVFPSPDTFWFLTPETCENPEALTGIAKRIFDETSQLKHKEKLDPLKDPESRAKFLSNFKWDQSVLSEKEKSEVEKLLNEFNDIFSRHRLDIGGNTDFTVKLTPEHEKPMYTQGPPTPILLREDLIVELALMQYYGVITTLLYSKYSSPLFAQRIPSGALRLLIDLSRVNHLIHLDHDSHNFPITRLADASAHLAGKKLFAELDCSQAYFAVSLEHNQYNCFRLTFSPEPLFLLG